MKNTTTALINRGILLLFVVVLLGGCNRYLNAPSFNHMTVVEKNSELVGDEKEEIVGNVSKTIFDSIDRSNSNAESVETGVIEKTGMEIQVSEGRYLIFAGPAGNVFIYDDEGDLLIRELFDTMSGASSLTVDLSEQHTLFFDGGLEGATIRPAETLISNELTPGIWEVGKDIQEGTYSISIEYGIGHLQIFELDEEVRVYELIGGDYTQTESMVQLVDGQKLKITGVPLVQFEPTEVDL